MDDAIMGEGGGDKQKGSRSGGANGTEHDDRSSFRIAEEAA
jgi:hypothetical protein